jgi:hypothetical protein
MSEQVLFTPLLHNPVHNNRGTELAPSLMTWSRRGGLEPRTFCLQELGPRAARPIVAAYGDRTSVCAVRGAHRW